MPAPTQPHVVTVPANDRPELLRDMLASLSANVLDNWRISAGIEPGPHAAAIAAAFRERFGGDRCDVVVNETVLGIRLNPLRLIQRAFAGGAGLVLHVEDDLVLAPDATQLARWFYDNHRPEWLCLNLLAGACGSAGMLSDPRFPRALVESRTFNSIGFAVRRPEWTSYMLPAWQSDEAPLVAGGWAANWRAHAGWDWSIWGVLAVVPTLRCIQPVLARANHRGRFGVHARPEFHDRAFEHIEVSASAATDFELLATSAIPREIRSHLNLLDELTELRLAAEQTARRAPQTEAAHDGIIHPPALTGRARSRAMRLIGLLRKALGVG